MTVPADLTPADLGLPPRFAAWRPGQWDALTSAAFAPTRAVALQLPTGSGKSATYMGMHQLHGAGTTVVLTGTLALEEQLTREFAQLGLHPIRGRRHYTCDIDPHVTAADGDCRLGYDCPLKRGGCAYYDAMRNAQSGALVVTSYAWWLSHSVVESPAAPHPFAGVVNRLVCDEAHEAPEALTVALRLELSALDVERFLGQELPDPEDLSSTAWVQWAAEHVASGRLQALVNDGYRTPKRTRLGARRLLQTLSRWAVYDPADTIVYRPGRYPAITIDLLSPHVWAERLLFRGTRKVVLSSATLTRSTVNYLGLNPDAVTWIAMPSTFPAARRPWYLTPAAAPPFREAVRVDHRMTTVQRRAWIAHIVAIVGARADRKGIIHAVSYARGGEIVEALRLAYPDRAIFAAESGDGGAALRAFQASSTPGAVLVSPAATTGHDFPYTQCEYQILVKLPFPDRRDPMTAARQARDKGYADYLTLRTVIQILGRPMRAADDQCETFLTDAHGTWWAKRVWSDIPPDVRDAWRVLAPGTIPDAPPRLARPVK